MLASVVRSSLRPQAFNATKLLGAVRLKQDWVGPEFDLKTEEVGPQIAKFKFYNQVVWPPNYSTVDGPKKAEVFHYRENIKYSPDKMWIVCHMIRGLSIDEALKQLAFTPRKGAQILQEVLLEAQEKAIKDHNIEYRSNLWVAEDFARKSFVIKGVRKHARMRHGIVHYKFCNLFVRLEEGKPPAYVGRLPPRNGWQLMDDYMNWMRNRKIEYGW